MWHTGCSLVYFRDHIRDQATRWQGICGDGSSLNPQPGDSGLWTHAPVDGDCSPESKTRTGTGSRSLQVPRLGDKIAESRCLRPSQFIYGLVQNLKVTASGCLGARHAASSIRYSGMWIPMVDKVSIVWHKRKCSTAASGPVLVCRGLWAVTWTIEIKQIGGTLCSPLLWHIA